MNWLMSFCHYFYLVPRLDKVISILAGLKNTNKFLVCCNNFLTGIYLTLPVGV